MAAGESNSEASSNGMVDSTQDDKEVERRTQDNNKSEASTDGMVYSAQDDKEVTLPILPILFN